MTEPTTEELVERLTGMKGPNYIPTWVIILMAQAAQRLSDLEGKLGEALVEVAQSEEQAARWSDEAYTEEFGGCKILWSAKAEQYLTLFRRTAATLAETRGLLKPFADTGAKLDPKPKDDACWAGQTPAPPITFGHLRAASEALKLTASGGGEDNSLSQGAKVAHPSVRPDSPNSAGAQRPPSEMPADFRAAVDAEMSGSWLNSLTRDDDEWFFDMDGKP